MRSYIHNRAMRLSGIISIKEQQFVSGKIYMRMKEQCMYVDAYVKSMRNFGGRMRNAYMRPRKIHIC